MEINYRGAFFIQSSMNVLVNIIKRQYEIIKTEAFYEHVFQQSLCWEFQTLQKLCEMDFEEK